MPSCTWSCRTISRISSEVPVLTARRTWVGGGEAGQQVGQGVGADRGRRPRTSRPATPRRIVQALAPVGQRGHGMLGEGEERLPGLGEPHPAPGADEQLLAQGGLQALQAGGQGGLGDEQRLGGPAEVLAPGNLEKGLDLGQHLTPHHRGSRCSPFTRSIGLIASPAYALGHCSPTERSTDAHRSPRPAWAGKGTQAVRSRMPLRRPAHRHRGHLPG